MVRLDPKSRRGLALGAVLLASTSLARAELHGIIEFASLLQRSDNVIVGRVDSAGGDPDSMPFIEVTVEETWRGRPAERYRINVTRFGDPPRFSWPIGERALMVLSIREDLPWPMLANVGLAYFPIRAIAGRAFACGVWSDKLPGVIAVVDQGDDGKCFELRGLKAWATGNVEEACALQKPVTAEYLASLSAIPFSIETGDGDPCYWAIVAKGLAVVPELVDLLADPMPTQHSVPLFGGEYAVGDIALNLLGDIVDVPVVELLGLQDSEQFKTSGYYVYWEYVRASLENRRSLSDKIGKWLAKKQSELRWSPLLGTRTGGVFRASGEAQK
jgi:hypothetical protein